MSIAFYQNEYENAAKNAISFGGFYSNQYGNPLASRQNGRACPGSNSSYLAYMDNTHDLMYCIMTNQLNTTDMKLPQKRQPPFVGIPQEELETTSYMVSDDSKVWTRLIDSKMGEAQPAKNIWTTMESVGLAMENLHSMFTQNFKGSKLSQSKNDKVDDKCTGLSKGAVAGLSIASTTVFCVFVGIFLSFWRIRKSQTNGYTTIQS